MVVKLFSTIYENAQKANSENREVYINKTLILFNNMRNVENDINAIFYLQNKMCFRDSVQTTQKSEGDAKISILRY